MPKAKLFLIVGAHVLAVIGVLCLLWVTRYPILTQELFTADAAKSYEESNAFADSVTNANYNILDEIRYQTLYDTDGKYDPDKIVDVAKYEDTGEITGKDETGLSFRLGDLYSWGKLISESMTDYDAARSKLDKQDGIIVCKRSDGTYHYFHYKDFKQMIDYGELSFVITGDSSADDILTELKQGEYQESNSGESRFRGLQDIDGKIAYINCWNYDGERVVGDYKTVNGETVLQLVNNSKEWNGKLNEAYRMINNSAETIYSDVDNYAVAQNQYQEGNTNITYLYVNLDNKTVITNKKKYQNFDNYKENLKKMKKSGKYVIVRPKLADYESNIEKAGKGDSMAQKWQETVAGYVDASDYIYVSVVDTDYPVKDNFYEQNEIFTRYGAGAKVAGILGMAAVAAYLVILVFLTIGAGKVKEDETGSCKCAVTLGGGCAGRSKGRGIYMAECKWRDDLYGECGVVSAGNSGWKCGGIVYLRNVSFRIFESGEKNQGGNGMEEQCAQMAFDLRKRNVPEYPSSVEIYYGICNLLHDPLAYVRIWISGK